MNGDQIAGERRPVSDAVAHLPTALEIGVGLVAFASRLAGGHWRLTCIPTRIF